MMVTCGRGSLIAGRKKRISKAMHESLSTVCNRLYACGKRGESLFLKAPPMRRAFLPCGQTQVMGSSGRCITLPIECMKDIVEKDTIVKGSESELNSFGGETIVAIVTGSHSQGSVSIIRMSGTDAVDIARQVFKSPSRETWNPKTHRIYYGHAYDFEGNVLDEVLALVMLGPKSFTAENVVEIHTHGGGVCAHRVLHACIAAGARLAKPGEFSLRAFLNGRIDLSQAESIAALIDARTVAAADSAIAGLNGGLGQQIQEVRQECLDILVELDARLDFDEDLPPLNVSEISERLKRASERIRAALATAKQGQLLRKGLQIALIGRPNAGKSSLLNALSGTNKSIVTDIAGTTRDVVEAGLVVGGIPVILLDTAGMRHTADEVEKIGVERSVATARSADLVVMVMDNAEGWTKEDDEILKNFWGAHDSTGKRPPAILVKNKSDLVHSVDTSGSCIENDNIPVSAKEYFAAVVRTSAITGEGLDNLQHELLQLAQAPEMVPGGISWAVNERQAEALNRAQQSLAVVLQSVAQNLPVDFWTIDIRDAVIALGEVSGEEITEEVLDNIFSRFCIGK